MMKIPNQSEKITLLQSNNDVKKISQIAEGMQQKSASDQELRRVTQEFESLFLQHLMKAMRATVPKSDLFHGGQREEIFTEMLDQEIAKAASKRGTGLADVLYQQLRKTLSP